MTHPPETTERVVLPHVPSGQAGWWHEYVCPTHGTELQAGSGPLEPADHRCPYGCRLTGAPYDGAWRVLQHQYVAREIRLRAHRYRNGGRADDRRAAVQLLHVVGDRYASATAEGWASSAQGWMLRGKLFHQALTESIWGTSLADGVDAIAEGDRAAGRSSSDLLPFAVVLTGIIDTVREARTVLVDERGDLTNNYTAWLNCAGVTAARALVALGEPADPARWLEDEAGQYAHAAASILPDGWEWEGSTYYHYFVLRAYLISLRGACPRDLPPTFVERLEAMLRVLADLATADGTLPVLHDGPLRRAASDQEILEVCVLGRQLTEGTDLEHVERGARQRLGSRAELESWLGHWFDGPPVPADRSRSVGRSRAFADAGHLVLRAPSGRWQAVIDAGPHGGAHGHRDKLSVYLYGRSEQWQPAPGVPPYGSELRHGYYARSQAHPTIRVDGIDQRECDGHLLHWTCDEVRTTAVVGTTEAYPGVDLQRFLVLENGYLLDAVQVRADAPHNLTLALRPAHGLHATTGGTLHRSRWNPGGDGDDGASLYGVHACVTDDRFAVVPARGPSDDPARVVAAVDWSTDSDDTWFVSVYVPADDGAERVQSLLVDVSSDDVLTVQMSTPSCERRVLLRRSPSDGPLIETHLEKP